MAASGDVRELTEVEIEFGRGDVVLEVPEKDGAVWNPGPRGLGVWWLAEPDADQVKTVKPKLRFARIGWRERQMVELNYALDLIQTGLDVVEGQLRNESASAVWSEEAVQIVRNPYVLLQERHEPAGWGKWASIPAQWQCDFVLEHDLTQGLTVGCPLPETHGALQQAWVDVGLVVEELDRVGRVEDAWRGLSGKESYTSLLDGERLYAVYDLASALDRLDASLFDLFMATQGEHLPMWASVS